MDPSSAWFVALGGVWLDEIRIADKATETNIVGGSLTFATLGARLFATTDPSRVRLVFLAGDDFPEDVISIFRKWKVGLTVHYVSSLPSARGVIQYDGIDESRRTYQRLTQPLQTTWEHLTTPDILNATCFHLFETPENAALQSNEILRKRNGVTDRPLFIWEPQGKSCKTETLGRHMETAKIVDVFSPNNAELHSLFENNVSLAFDSKRIEAQAKHFIDTGVGHDNKGCVVVRCAEHGCLIMSHDAAPCWLPAFYDSGSEEVVDATGGGNSFLGGFGAGYHMTGSFVEAAKYGNIAASFVIEQMGVPEVSGEGDDERWNGEKVRDRLAEYESRLQKSRK